MLQDKNLLYQQHEVETGCTVAFLRYLNYFQLSRDDNKLLHFKGFVHAILQSVVNNSLARTKHRPLVFDLNAHTYNYIYRPILTRERPTSCTFVLNNLFHFIYPRHISNK
jgi:hypothetical protein